MSTLTRLSSFLCVALVTRLAHDLCMRSDSMIGSCARNAMSLAR